MSELRCDPIVGRWVVVNTDDSMKPGDFEKEDQSLRQAATCQFCSGKERQTPPEVDALRPANSPSNSPGWQVRVVSNKFPALRIEGDLNKRAIGIFDVCNGIGAHEVVIETPDHSKKNLADFSVEDIVNVLKKYQNRVLSLARDKRFKYIMLFKNYGSSAGASVEHAHSQIIALPMVPKYVLEELEGAREYFQLRGRCVFCDIIHQEYEDKKRIIAGNDEFLSFCPFVPRYTFESWIIPKRHNSDFGSLNDGEQHHLAAILKEVLTRIKVCLEDPSYNFYLHITPVNSDYGQSYHWHFEIVPNLTRVAGFEWGTGFHVVRTSPDLAAEYLRKVAYK